MGELSVSIVPFVPARLAFNAAGANRPADLPAPPAEIDTVLAKAWDHYKKTMIAPDGRPLADRDDNDIDGDGDRSERVTVSEAVSYVLLRAVWMNDKQAFDKTWNWAEKHLQRKNLGRVYDWNKKKWVAPPKPDHLFAWRYVPTLKGEPGGVINYKWIGEAVWRGCFEGAMDADIDITAALIFAGKRWQDDKYQVSARAIMNDMWDKYVDYLKPGKPLLYGGDQFKGSEINPSYMRPAYYKMFAAFDPAHPWNELFDTSYQIIVKGGDQKLGSVSSTTNLPPNWLGVRANGALGDSQTFASQGGDLFGWDSFRTLFWVAQDYAWHGTPEAKSYLTDNSCTRQDAGPYCFLNKELSKGQIMGGYRRDGEAVTGSGWWANNLNQEQFAMNGAYLSYFHFAGDKTAAKKLYANLQKMYHEDGYWGDNPNDYYGQNWAWFGLALISGKAVNLFTPGVGVFKPAEAPHQSKPLEATPVTPEPQPKAEAVPTAPSANALTLESIKQGSFDFNGGKAPLSAGIYKFSAHQAKDPGFGIQTGNHDLKGKTTFTFEIKGSVKKLGEYASFIVQIYDAKNKSDSNPSIDRKEIKVTKDWTRVTVDLEDTIKNVKKVQFLLATPLADCDIKIRDPRFE